MSKAKPAKEKPRAEHRAIKRVSNQKGVAEGMTKFFCDGRMKAFEHPTAERAPAACPEGHRNAVAETATA